MVPVSRSAAVISRPEPMASVPPLRLTSAPKILLYSHDTFGLGNIRRTLLLAGALREEWPGAAVLIVTGSPVIHSFRVPEGIDYIKLPCLDRVAADNYRPKFLADWSAEVTRLRRAILRRTVLGFGPDLMIVDKRAGGIDGELVDTLRTLRRSSRPVRLVLGIRDILDEPEKTRHSLEKSGCLQLAERYFDEVWIYGEQAIFDAVREYGFPTAVAGKTRFCGYLRRPTTRTARKPGPPRVLVATGGGGDGSEMIRTYLEGLSALPRSIAIDSTVVFGPEMPEAERAAIYQRFGAMADVTFVDFEPDMTHRYAEADVVVSMAGYNTVCELLSFGLRAVLVPRAFPVSEQLVRARLLAARGCCEVVEPEELRPDRLLEAVQEALRHEPRPVTVDLEGLPRIRERARALLGSEFE